MARSWREIRAERNIDPQKIAEYREKMLQAIDAFPECAHIYFDFDFDGTCTDCGHQVFTRDAQNNRVYPSQV